MPRSTETPSVLTLRISAALRRSLASEARRRKTTKSELVRELLVAGLGGGGGAASLAAEARRQSTLVSGRRSEQDALDLLEDAADTEGWA